MTPEERERRFRYHAPNEHTRELHERARMHTLAFAETIDELVEGDESRELSLMWTHFETAMFWLHAHLARNR